MIEYIPENQPSLFDFKTPFRVPLNPENRWVKLASIVPWDAFTQIYLSKMNSTQGRRALPPRMILGALIIKYQENLSDEKTILAIQENVYMQFFVGLGEFQTQKIFDSSLFVTIRKRFGKEAFDQLSVELIKDFSRKKDHAVKSRQQDSEQNPPNSGKLQADATVADQYITFPTDAKLLNTARETLDNMIDKIYLYNDKSFDKPRTYRRALRASYLTYSKKKNKTKSTHRMMKRKLLESVKRNLGFIERYMPDPDQLIMGKDYPLTKGDLQLIEVIKTLYKQQKQMYDEKTNTCKDRIVSLHQSHVRPIVRGKQNSRVEFGSKIGVSLDNGFARVDTFSWNAYHEGEDLEKHVTNYFNIHGYYPEVVLVDKAYSTRKNRTWLKTLGIRITAPKLGRKPKESLNYYQKQKLKKEAAQRNHIEGKFGQGKNAYNLNKIRAKLKETSESWVSCIFFIMNLINYQKKYPFGVLLYHILQLLAGVMSNQRFDWEKFKIHNPIYKNQEYFSRKKQMLFQ